MTDDPPPTPPVETATRGFVRNALGGTAATVLTIAVGFFWSRYLIQTVGPARFGVWTLAFSLARYTTLLDAGFLSAVRRYQARSLARHDADESNAVLAISLAIYLAVGVAAFAICASAVGWLPRLVETPDGLRAELTVVLLIAGGYTLFGFLRSCFMGLLFGANRVDLSRGVMLVDRLVVATVGFAALELWRPDLVGAACASAVAGVLSVVVAVALAKRVQPAMRISFSPWRGALAREMLVFSAGALLLTVAGLSIEHVPKFVVGAVWDATEVGLFAVPWLLVGYLFQGTGPISSSVLPMAARLETEGEHRLRDLYTRSSRAMLAFGLAAAVPLGFYAAEFLVFFAGEEYLTVGPVLVVLLVGEVCRVGQITGLHILTATRSIERASVGQTVNAVVAIAAATWVATSTDLGLVGVAAAVSLSGLLYWGLFVPADTTRQLHMSLPRYLVAAVVPALAAGSIHALLCAYARSHIAPRNLVETLAVMAALGLVGLAVAFVVAFDRDDRARLIGAVRRRI